MHEGKFRDVKIFVNIAAQDDDFTVIPGEILQENNLLKRLNLFEHRSLELYMYCPSYFRSRSNLTKSKRVDARSTWQLQKVA